MANTPSSDDEFIFVASITLRNGRKIYAANYGKKAFRIKVNKSRKQTPKDGTCDDQPSDGK